MHAVDLGSYFAAKLQSSLSAWHLWAILVRLSFKQRLGHSLLFQWQLYMHSYHGFSCFQECMTDSFVFVDCNFGNGQLTCAVVYYRYAGGATIQIILFGILAVQIKMKAPSAHTVLEIVYARWGTVAHLVSPASAFLLNCFA